MGSCFNKYLRIHGSGFSIGQWVEARKVFEVLDRKRLDCLEESVGRNMSVKGALGEVSDGSEEHVTGNWRKGDPYYKGAENLTELCLLGGK